MTECVTIPARYNGPPDSGNGGYSCGLLASFIDGTARVRLHRPPPLDTALRVARDDEGAAHMYLGDDLVGSAVPAELTLEVPQAPTLQAARAATADYVGHRRHTFPSCYVCGPGRPAHDGLALFTGPAGSWQLLASPWRPAADTLDRRGAVRSEILWAALDCPGYFACMGAEPRAAVLGELTAQVQQAVAGDQELIVFAWPLGREGRKHWSGTAIADADGHVLAKARATWIELKS